ncbi:hypothetical protein ACS0TY_011493 [Phlomoides rotata]
MTWMVWDQRNRYIFYGTQVRISATLASFWAHMREGNFGNLGHMHNLTFDLEVLYNFGISGKPSKAPSIIRIRWQLPPCDFMKINTDGGTAGAPGDGLLLRGACTEEPTFYDPLAPYDEMAQN